MKPVLLLIDLQRDFLSSRGLFPAAGWTVAQATRLLAGFRGASWPVVHVWTTVHRQPDHRMAHWRRDGDWRCLDGTPGHDPPPSLQPVAGEEVVHKTAFSAFHGTRLDPVLLTLGGRILVLAGVHLHGCIRASALDAYQRGYQVWVAEDAVASDDPLHGEISRQYLESRAAAFTPVDFLLARLGGEVAESNSSAPLLPVASLGDRRLFGTDGEAITHVSPRRPSQRLWRSPVAGLSEVEAAVAAARRAAPAWRRLTPVERCVPLQRLLEILARDAEPIARLLAVEVGKPLIYGRAEVAFAIDLLRAVIGAGLRQPRNRVDDGRYFRRLPLGVVALVTPWNNPAAVPLGKVAPALLFGNAVVWKPSPRGLGVALELQRRLIEAGVPPGLVPLVSGPRSTAEALMADPGVDGISLTGSEAAGFTAGVTASRRGIPLQAELGGNNGAIIWSDADLDAAGAAVAEGAFGAAGQRCTATRRVVVERTCRDAFLERLTAAVGKLGWGDPLKEGVSVGPLISAGALDRVAGVLERASAEGCETIAPHLAGDGGAEVPGEGFYLPPTLVLDPDPGSEIVQEETFGPVLVVQSAYHWEDALRLLNGVRQGLVAALFSRSVSLRESFLERAEAGVLKIGESTAGVAAHLPFGGWKRSGAGPPEHGESDLEAYTRLQALYFGREG
jgi:alpha-ketoglutaric semialdehyde dehydrogenase